MAVMREPSRIGIVGADQRDVPVGDGLPQVRRSRALEHALGKDSQRGASAFDCAGHCISIDTLGRARNDGDVFTRALLADAAGEFGVFVTAVPRTHYGESAASHHLPFSNAVQKRWGGGAEIIREPLRIGGIGATDDPDSRAFPTLRHQAEVGSAIEQRPHSRRRDLGTCGCGKTVPSFPCKQVRRTEPFAFQPGGEGAVLFGAERLEVWSGAPAQFAAQQEYRLRVRREDAIMHGFNLHLGRMCRLRQTGAPVRNRLPATRRR
jgi:hypothetical protein